MAGAIIVDVVSILNCVVLFIISATEAHFKTAWIFRAISLVIGFVITPNVTKSIFLTLLVAIISLVMSIVSEYAEMTGYAVVVSDMNEGLSRRWETLRVIMIVLLCTTTFAVFAAIISPQLAIITLLLSAIGMLVKEILQVIYLYQTAQCFRN